MVNRVLIALFIFSTFLFANVVDEKVKTLVSPNDYVEHQYLIKLLFKDKDKYIKNSVLDSVAVAQTLKDNGLLRLYFDKPEQYTVTFKTNEYPLFFIKLLSDALQSMGYYFFITKEAIQTSSGFSWKIVMETEYAIDPTLFAKELDRRGCKVVDVERKKSTEWEYVIDLINAKIVEATQVDRLEKIKLKKPLNDYILEVKDAKQITLISHTLNSWYPYVVFLDRHLHLLDMYKKDVKIRRVTLRVPEGTRYIKITDIYTLDNLKRGMKVLIR